MIHSSITIFRVLPLLLALPLAAQADWPQFRGPNGSGVAQDGAPTPTTWSATKNLAWKIPLPGAGISCPIVSGDKVFVTCYSGYGLDRRNPGDIKNLKRHLVCVDRKTGKIEWDHPVAAAQPEDAYSGMGIPEHGYASHTPVTDGEHVYVFFGKSGVLAYNLEGDRKWQTSVGTESDRRRWGSASSLILYNNLVIATASAESESLVGLEKSTGDEVWRQEAGGLANVWGTPALSTVSEERTDLVISVPNEIWGLNPETGKLRWYCDALRSDQANSSVLVHGETIYAMAGRGGGSIAVRAGGKGDVSKTHTLWTGRDSNRYGTPLLHEDRLYSVSDGMLACIDSKNGKQVYQERLQAGGGGVAPEAPRGGGRGFGSFGGRSSDYASPVLAHGKLYYQRGNGEMHVTEIGDESKHLAVNKLNEGTERFGATPAISQGRIFIRSDKHLYCVATEDTK